MNRELIYETLFQYLTAPPLVFSFAADITAGDTVLNNVSDTSGLLLGMPIWGQGIPAHAVLASLDPVTLSAAPTQSLGGVALGQGFQTIGRRLRPVAEVARQPALFLVEGDEEYPALGGSTQRQSNVPAIITLEAFLWVYARVTDPDALPSAVLNALLDGIDKALLPPATAPNGVWQNLGLSGVLSVRVEGRPIRDGGHFDGQAGARVPIAIRVAQGFDTAPLT